MSNKKKELVHVELRLPKHAIDILNSLAVQKILGETVEEVVLHIVRQKLFEEEQEQMMKVIASRSQKVTGHE